ncbi:MAG TPA: carboxypeptidase-like regulatory domain-containing protein [Actinomycetota bacterium]|nr:carboxypeptidase-like regulatory domain-containing protein [Actinomycetota bacterium]
MRRLTILAAVAASVALVPFSPARSASTGTIVGRVVNGTTDRAQPGVEITLTMGTAGDATEKVVESDRRGRYRFEDLPAGEENFYVLDAEYAGGLFAGRPLTIPSDTQKKPVIETTLRVFEPTTDPNAILIRRDDLFVIHDEDRVSVVEAIKVVNPTNNAYIGRGSALSATDDDGVTPSLGFAMPDGVVSDTFRWLDADLDVPQAVEIQGVGFGITSAIPPGEVDFTFSYQVEGTGGTFDLSRRALYTVSELSVFAADPLEVTANRLSEAGEVTLEGTTYRRFTSESDLDPADPVQILIVAEGSAGILLLAGLGAGLAILILIAVLAFRRTKKGKQAVPRAPIPRSRDEILAAIARLDAEFEAGGMQEAEYLRDRAALKGRLESNAQPVGP